MVFEEHIGLVKSIVSSFDRSCPPEDSELFAVACIGLMKAIRTFDGSSSKFSYWATKIIRNMLIGEKRKKREWMIPMSAVASKECLEPMDRDPGLPLDLVSLLTAPSSEDTDPEKEDKKILRRHFLDHVSMAEMARELGVSREGIRQRTNRAIRSIQKKHKNILDNHPSWLAGNSTRGLV